MFPYQWLVSLAFLSNDVTTAFVCTEGDLPHCLIFAQSQNQASTGSCLVYITIAITAGYQITCIHSHRAR